MPEFQNTFYVTMFLCMVAMAVVGKEWVVVAWAVVDMDTGLVAVVPSTGFALVVVDLDKPWVVEKDNILYHCGWSPFEGEAFKSSVVKTF